MYTECNFLLRHRNKNICNYYTSCQKHLKHSVDPHLKPKRPILGSSERFLSEVLVVTNHRAELAVILIMYNPDTRARAHRERERERMRGGDDN